MRRILDPHTIEVPPVPDALMMDGKLENIARIDDDELKAVGEQWTRDLLKRREVLLRDRHMERFL